MNSRPSKVGWTTSVAAIVVLGVAAFLIGRHDAGGGAQAQPNPPRYEPEEAGSRGGRSASDRDLIYAAELIGPEKGWALTSSRLAWTTDGGTSWSTVTPPGIVPGAMLAAHFDESGDGVVAACQEINAAPPRLEFFRTSDGGRTWQFSTLEAEGPGSIGKVRMSEADGVWWALIAEAGVASSGQRLYRSADGGKSWQEASSRPFGRGQFVFLSAEEGWNVAGSGTAQEIFRTDDAGESWEGIRLPLPAGAPEVEEGTPPEPGHHTIQEEEVAGFESPDRSRVEYGLPERGPDGVLLPVTITDAANDSEVLLYERSDGGDRKLVSTTDLTGSVGLNNSELTTTFAGSGVLVIQDPGPDPDSTPAIAKVSTQSGDPKPSTNAKSSTSNFAPASGLGRRGVLNFVDPSHGITVTGTVCSVGGCSEETEVLLTSDGGRSWSPAPTRP
jgi:photosystem II stability/assembly factor-like uncharacterized protein